MLTMETLAKFNDRVSEFIDRTGLAPSRFGFEACGDPNFVTDLRAGREPRESTRSKVEKFMDGYKMPGTGNDTASADPSRTAAA